MSALHLMRDGMITAAELLALLLIAPVDAASAAENALQPAATRTTAVRSAAPASTAATPAERRLHLVDAALEMRFLGLLADVRVVQTVRNDTAQTVDLGTHLPATEASVDSLSITRDGRSLALLGGTDCGGEDDPDAGHVSASEDEAIADLMQLPPGRQATVEVAATDTLQPAGARLEHHPAGDGRADPRAGAAGGPTKRWSRCRHPACRRHRRGDGHLAACDRAGALGRAGPCTSRRRLRRAVGQCRGAGATRPGRDRVRGGERP